MTDRPRLTPAIADVRRAVRESWDASGVVAGDLVLVACSGGPDSLALAAAVAFEAPRAGISAGAVIVEHGIQAITKDVAARTAEVLRTLGLDPVLSSPDELARYQASEITKWAKAVKDSGAKAQ